MLAAMQGPMAVAVQLVGFIMYQQHQHITTGTRSNIEVEELVFFRSPNPTPA
jgi:hypothetical protein